MVGSKPYGLAKILTKIEISSFTSGTVISVLIPEHIGIGTEMHFLHFLESESEPKILMELAEFSVPIFFFRYCKKIWLKIFNFTLDFE